MKAKAIVALLIALACAAIATDRAMFFGAAIGLLLGTLLAPKRISGVDFRQWLKDPGTPSEIGDDSYVGLVRGGFATLAPIGLVAALLLLWVLPGRMPVSCDRFDLAGLGATTGPAPLGGIPAAMLMPCSGFAAGAKIGGGAIAGFAAIHALVEIVWRVGLKRGLQQPVPPNSFYFDRALPRVRSKQANSERRRLIVCCDGTWNWPESRRETNVVRLVRALKPNDNGVAQIIYYHRGVGTGNIIDRWVGGGAGVGLSASVKTCYGFLADNYRVGDDIFLFGFSRGAYVARALGGLIGQIGILQKYEMDRFADAWNWYWQESKVRADSKGTFDALVPDRHRDVEIECIGVWDTVGALGIPGMRFCASTFKFHETALGAHVRHAFQALAIDEQRGNFQAAIWVPFQRNWHEQQARQSGLPSPREPDGPRQVLKQVWFPGVHSNIGGGYPEHGLSDTSFLWMLSQLDAHNLLGLDETCIDLALDHESPEQYCHGKLQDSRTRFWKLIGCPIPRPVCVISNTEQLHKSAIDRRCKPQALPALDIYLQQGRGTWLEGIEARQNGIIAERTVFETKGRKRTRPPQGGFRPIRDWCTWLVETVSSRS